MGKKKESVGWGVRFIKGFNIVLKRSRERLQNQRPCLNLVVGGNLKRWCKIKHDVDPDGNDPGVRTLAC